MDERYERLLDTRFGLRPGYFFAFPRPFEMQVRNSHLTGSLVSVSGREQDGWIATAFGRIDGSTPLREIVADVPAPVVESFLKILLSLRQNFLQTGANASSEQTGDAEGHLGQMLLHATSRAADDYQQAIDEAKILVIGAGVLGSRVATGLVQAGVGNLTILDRQFVMELDKRNCPAYVFAREGNPRAEELRNFLVQMAGHEQTAALHWDAPNAEELTRLMEAHTMVLLVEDEFDPRLQRLVNDCALALNLPWSMARIDGWDLYIGPAFLPGQTGCSECLQQMRVSQMDKPDTYLRYEEHLMAGELSAKLFVTPTAADLVAGLLVSDVPNVLGWMPQRIDFDASLTLGRQLHMNLRNYDAVFHPVAKLPRCKSCGTKK